MAVDPALLDQLLKLGEAERLEIARAMLESVDDEDDLDDEERARLDASLARSLEDIKSGPSPRCSGSDCRAARAEASTQLAAITAWWSINRTGSPDVVATELEAALEQLESTPLIGRQRRILLRRSEVTATVTRPRTFDLILAT